MKKYNELRESVREDINARYRIPSDRSNVYLDDIGRPFERSNGVKLMCTIRKESLICGGFHNNHAKNRN